MAHSFRRAVPIVLAHLILLAANAACSSNRGHEGPPADESGGAPSPDGASGASHADEAGARGDDRAGNSAGGSGGAGGDEAEGGTAAAGAGDGETAGGGHFQIRVEPASFELPADGSVWLTVRVEREPGFLAPIRVQIPELPAELSADSLLLPAAVSTAFLPVTAAASFEGSPARDLVIRATGDAETITTTVRASAGGASASSQQKIRAAVAAGNVDHDTSLAYRAYALWGDDRLPAELVGSGSEAEDQTLSDEIALRGDDLSSSVRALLQPFVERPTAPESIWNAASEPSRGVAKHGALPATVFYDSCAQSGIDGTWISRRGASEPLRVWVRCIGQEAADVESERLLERTLALLHKIYAPMVGLMRPPVADRDGGDDAIDFYVIDPDASIYRADGWRRPLGYATTVRDEPMTSKTSSAFVLVPRSLFYMSRFHTTLIHEFFHVLQKAYNRSYSIQELPDQVLVHWFPEASAVWASAHFDRTLAPWDTGRGAYTDAHYRFLSHFQPSDVGLSSRTPASHPYAAYIWPFFVEQETRSPDFMPRMWEALEAVSDFDAADDAISQAFPFSDHFKDFALRNLNDAFTPGDPLPKSKRYASLDPDFPDGRPPPYLEGQLEPGQSFRTALELPNLSARYVRLRAAPTVRKVELELGGLQPRDLLDARALVHTLEGWVSEPLDFGHDGRVVFCFEKGPTTIERRGSFDTMLLVLSNHAVRQSDGAGGELVVNASDRPCALVYRGSVDMEDRIPIGLGTIHVKSSASVKLELDDSASSPVATVYRLRSGTFAYDVLYDLTGRSPPCRSTGRAAGTIPQFDSNGGSSAHLYIRNSFDPPTYTADGFISDIARGVTNCTADGKDVAWENPAVFNFWLIPAPGPLIGDGEHLQGTVDGPDNNGGTVHYGWSLDRVDD